MALGKLESKAVVDDLEEKKPKRGASCGEANPRPDSNAASRRVKPRSRGFHGGGTRSQAESESGPQGRSVSNREGNGKGEWGLDESQPLRGERSP
jgi:hypothetical protein